MSIIKCKCGKLEQRMKKQKTAICFQCYVKDARERALKRYYKINGMGLYQK